MNRNKIKQIILAEKQAQFYCVENSRQWKTWLADAYTIRRQIGEYRPWHQLISIYELRGEV